MEPGVDADNDANNDKRKKCQNNTKPEYKYKPRAGWLLQVADKWEEDKNQFGNLQTASRCTTVIQPELTAAVEATSAIMSNLRQCEVIF